MRTTVIACILLVLTATMALAIVSPKDGGKLPRAYYDRVEKDSRAFLPKRGWIQKFQAMKLEREAYIEQFGAANRSLIMESYSVAGNFSIPIMMGAYSNRSAPYSSGNLQTELFDGPWPTGTLSDYYDEVSYGMMNVTGTVYPWFTVSNPDVYYEGDPGSNGLGSNARTGEFLKELLDAHDATVNFGQYDNDGPDGVPNSGDDDGYVDFIAFVHSEAGGECGGGSDNMWSHSWVYSAWAISGGLPYQTNDARNGGGYIMVDDYTMQPSLSCSATMIEIGIFCHEFGHAFGLPDLYDANGGGPSGIGHWGIMGSGNWNTPARPAHYCAWSKRELGWLVPTLGTITPTLVTIHQAETNPVAYMLAFTDDHFRRMNECNIDGLYSLRCGITNTEGTTKGWLGSGGYGNNWNESIERDFTFDGTTPVTFTYDYQYQLEPGYDYAYANIRVGGSEVNLRSYDAYNGSGSESIDLTPILSGHTPPIEYQLVFRVTSDFAWSDEDNKNPTTCGAFIVDNIGVTGGGETYFTDFESFLDGWHQDPVQNPATEYFLIENRQAAGFDQHLHGSGLLIYHIDDEVLYGNMSNCGSPCEDYTAYNGAVYGMVVEQADGLNHLFSGTNRGDAGDPFPGSSNNTSFTGATNPNSDDNTARPTLISVTGISASGNPMTATIAGGDPSPLVTNSDPSSVDNDMNTVDLTVSGELIRYGAAMALRKSGQTDILALSTDWVDYKRIRGTFYIRGRVGGFWELLVTNPDGQEFVYADALFLNQIVATQLKSAAVSAVTDGIQIRLELTDLDREERLIIRRSAGAAGPWAELAASFEEIEPGTFVMTDRQAQPGRTYYYQVGVEDGQGKVRELYQGSGTMPSGKLVLEQNYPNPFNPATKISFYLPERAPVRLDIFDVNGRLVKTLASGNFQPGPYTLTWNGDNRTGERVTSGVYIYRLTVGREQISRKMTLLK